MFESDFNEADKIISSEKKKYFKLFNYYQKIILINNYSEVEDKLYEKYGIKNEEKKARFELQRIHTFIDNNEFESNEYRERLNILESFFDFCIDNINSECIEKYMYGLFKSIIELEISLGMNIALYKELCEVYEKEFKEKYIVKKELKNNGK